MREATLGRLINLAVAAIGATVAIVGAIYKHEALMLAGGTAFGMALRQPSALVARKKDTAPTP